MFNDLNEGKTFHAINNYMHKHDNCLDSTVIRLEECTSLL